MKLIKKIGIATCMTLAVSLCSQVVWAKESTTIQVAKNIDLDVTVEKLAEIEKTGSLGDITIEEMSIGDLTYSSDEDERTIILSLMDTEYTFEKLPSVVASKGFKGMNSKIKVQYLSKRGDDAFKEIAIILPRNTAQSQKGKLEISGLKVETKEDVDDKDLNLGIGLLEEKEYKDIKVATILSYGAALKVDKVYELKAGDSKLIDFDLEEGRSESLVDGRKIEFTVDNGGFQVDKEGKLILDEIYLNGTKITKNADISTYDVKNGRCKSFTITISGLEDSKRDVISFEGVSLGSDLGEAGDVYLSVESRDFSEVLKQKIAVIEEMTNVTSSNIVTPYGVSKKKGGQIVISEEAKRSLEVGEIKLTFEGLPYVEFIREPLVEVTEGNLQVKPVGWEEDNVYVIKVTKKSTKPSVLIIKDFTYNISNVCPSGTFSLTISGNSIAADSTTSAIKIDDFVTVTDKEEEQPVQTKPVVTPNTTQTDTLVTKFKLGSNSYEMNGISYQMDAAAFSSKGRTMVPVRYVAKAAGLGDHAISFSGNTIRIQGTKNIELVIGSNVMKCNGESIIMDAAVVNVGGRTYVPVAEIAKALGIRVNWVGETQTAIFTK